VHTFPFNNFAIPVGGIFFPGKIGESNIPCSYVITAVCPS
jgi:hypothetical protein